MGRIRGRSAEVVNLASVCGSAAVVDGRKALDELRIVPGDCGSRWADEPVPDRVTRLPGLHAGHRLVLRGTGTIRPRGGRHAIHTRMRWFKTPRRACDGRQPRGRCPELQPRENPLRGDRGFGVVSRSARCRRPASPRTQSCRRAVGSTLVHHGMTTPWSRSSPSAGGEPANSVDVGRSSPAAHQPTLLRRSLARQ